jgi:hypothetical protein
MSSRVNDDEMELLSKETPNPSAGANLSMWTDGPHRHAWTPEEHQPEVNYASIITSLTTTDRLQ